jgi:hypothetical protein
MSESTNPAPDQRSEFVLVQTRVLQIIVCTLVVSVLMFAGFVVLSGHLQRPPQGQVLSYASLAMAMVMIVMHVVVPGFVERAALANQPVGTAEPELARVFVTRTIIACALLEGAAMMSLVALMIEHRPWVLGVTAVLVVLMLLQIPSRTRIEHWLESRRMDRAMIGR